MNDAASRQRELEANTVPFQSLTSRRLQSNVSNISEVLERTKEAHESNLTNWRMKTDNPRNGGKSTLRARSPIKGESDPGCPELAVTPADGSPLLPNAHASSPQSAQGRTLPHCSEDRSADQGPSSKSNELRHSGAVLLHSLNPSLISESAPAKPRSGNWKKQSKSGSSTQGNKKGVPISQKSIFTMSSCFENSKRRSFEIMRSSLVQNLREGLGAEVEEANDGRVSVERSPRAEDEEDVVGVLKSEDLKSNSADVKMDSGEDHNANAAYGTRRSYGRPREIHVMDTQQRAEMILNDSKVSLKSSQRFGSSMRSLELLVSKEAQP